MKGIAKQIGASFALRLTETTRCVSSYLGSLGNLRKTQQWTGDHCTALGESRQLLESLLVARIDRIDQHVLVQPCHEQNRECEARPSPAEVHHEFRSCMGSGLVEET